MHQKAIEQHTLMAGILANLFMGAAGMAAYYTSQIEALFVDAYFTVISLISGLVAIFISKLSTKVSKRFPNGLFILEPIFSLAQSLLTIVLLVSALATVSWNAYKYFAYGQGKIMDVGPIIPYEIIMLLLSFSLSAYYNQQNKKINESSTMLVAETKGTLIDGIMSTGIALAALTILFINQASIFNFFTLYWRFLHYLCTSVADDQNAAANYQKKLLLRSAAVRFLIGIFKRSSKTVCTNTCMARWR